MPAKKEIKLYRGEKWVTIPGKITPYGERYAISNHGRLIKYRHWISSGSILRLSRQQGYPGDEWYLEFHKMRWPGGLKLWRVTGDGVDLGAKQQYEPARARDRAHAHAGHFAGLLGEIANEIGRAHV